MSIIRLGGFRGEIPRIHPRLLPESSSQAALNCRLDSGALESVKDTANLQSTVVNNSIIGNLFDTSGGTTGAFTAVADASVSATVINSVTDSGGVARFNFTVGPTLFVNQEIVISTFTTNPLYNGTFVITAVGAGFFKVISIVFGSNEVGSFLSNSITLTDTGTVLSDGDTLVVDTDFSTEYDNGGTVYNQLVEEFGFHKKTNPQICYTI